MATESQGTALFDRKAWNALTAHHEEFESRQLKDLFAKDPERGTRYTAEAAGLFLDYSKNRVDDTTLKLLVELAEECGLEEKIEAMFRRGQDQRHRGTRGAACGFASAQG